jgi:hypothetical protein
MQVASPSWTPGLNGPDRPNIARIRDYWLGGSHYSEEDCELANRIVVCAPHIPYLVRAQRALLQRLVRHAYAQGVRQFLDLGSGVPTSRHVHEIAQDIDPECRVVYVDIDPGIASLGDRLLKGNDNVAFLQADIRQPEQVLDAPETRKLLDLDQPVAVLMIDTLMHFPDAENPSALVAAYVEATCSGSYLAISHFSESDELRTAFGLFDRMFGAPPAVTLRSREWLADFFAGLDLVDPGVVPVPLWRPSTDDEFPRNPELAEVVVGLGRKP